jgi:tRNA (guanine-N7-)-methyltransferase
LNPPSASDRPVVDGPPGDKTAPPGERIHFYGRRKGKAMKAGRLSLLDTLLPALRLAVPETGQTIDPASLFKSKSDEVRMEIGFGSGEHIAAQAAANPGVNFLGCEVFINGVASLLRYADEMRLQNLRIFDNDVRHLLPALKSASFSRISLPFPDPWPKARHAKRRFVGPTMLDEMARLLVDGGEFRVASDHPVYIAWTLQHAPEHPAFTWRAQGPEDWRTRPADSVPTRYEEKARAAGRTPVFMTFVRKPRPA